MASPALHTGHDILDPQRKAQYTINIPQDVLDSNVERTTYSSIRYNHKPANAGGTRTTKLRSGPRSSASLDIKERKDGTSSTYHYEGSKSSPKQSFVLIFDPNTQSATLQPLTASYSLNLKSTPTNSSPTQLAEQYPQLHESNDASDSVADNELASSMLNDEPDPDNPFDFRHFLDGAKAPRLSPSPALTPRNSAVAELSAARERSVSNPEGRNAQQSRNDKGGAPPRIRVQRKATDDTTSSAASSTRGSRPSIRDKKKIAAPSSSSRTAPSSIPRSIKVADVSEEFDLVRGASTQGSPADTHDAEDDDDDLDDFMGPSGVVGGSGSGGLEIDFGDEGPPMRSRARAITLPGSSSRIGGGRGPISLRSAANSPGSQVQTPRRSRLQDIEEVDVFELGPPRGSSSSSLHVLPSGGHGDDDDVDDADVSDDEETNLPVLFQSNHHVDSDDNDDDEEEGNNDDVEPMLLDTSIYRDSQRQHQQQQQQGHDIMSMEAAADDMDDVDMDDHDHDDDTDLAQGVWDGLSASGHVQRVEDSESESEAE